MDDAADLGGDLLSTSQRSQDSSLVRLANSILLQLHITKKITKYTQINGSLFVTMYEGLCGELLEDVIRSPRCLEDDVHNAQTVIDALALEVLHTSLSHISGEAIARGDRTAVGNLLDLFSSLVEFILNRIECDLSTDDEEQVVDKPVTSELIDEILARDRLNTNQNEDENNVLADDTIENTNEESKLDDLEPGRNSTLDLIRESEEIERRLNEQDLLRRQLEEEEERRFEMDEEERILFEEAESRRRIMEEDRRLAEEEKRLQEEGRRLREEGRRLEDEARKEEEQRRLVDEAIARYSKRRSPALDLSHDSSDAPLYPSSDRVQDRQESSSDYLSPGKGQYSSLLSLAEETCELSRSAVKNSPARAKAERSAFLEAAIKSALKKIDREAKGVEKLVDEVPGKRSVRMKLADEFNNDLPRKSSPMRSPYHSKTLYDDNNNADRDPVPSVTITSPPPARPEIVVNSSGKKKKAARVRPLGVGTTTRQKTDRLKHLYAYDYQNILEDHQDLNQEARRRSNNIEQNMRKNLSKSSRKSRPPVSERAKRVGRKKSASCSPPKRIPDSGEDKDSYLDFLLDAFPNLYLSTNTIQELWRQSVKQIEQLNKIEVETKRKDTLHQQLEEAARRQHLVSEIFRKDIECRRRMADVKERQAQERAVKQSIQEKRMQSARVRRYYQDFQLGMRAKMLQKRIKDEMVFKKLFKDGLHIQRQCIRDMRKYAKEQRAKKGKAQRDEIESLENFYRDQFMILADAMQKERVDLASRENAQNKVIDRMKRELRRRMESDVRDIQAQLIEEDDGHFRELDAETLHQDLLLAKYKIYA